MKKILFPEQSDYLENFRKKDTPLIEEMERFAQKNNVPILTKDAAEFIEQLVMISRPRRVLEIGTAIAYTTIRIARNLRKKGVIHTIEKSSDNIKRAKEYISRSDVKEKISILEGEAAEVIPELMKKYDFIFLDADKQDYKKLFELSLGLLKKGGIIFVDNLLWHGYTASTKVPADYKTSTEFIREFNKEFMNTPGLYSIIIPIGDGIGLGIKQRKNG
jgi:predicted O-methyltransferase YrrM